MPDDLDNGNDSAGCHSKEHTEYFADSWDPGNLLNNHGVIVCIVLYIERNQITKTISE